jgi:hypothetical protein
MAMWTELDLPQSCSFYTAILVLVKTCINADKIVARRCETMRFTLESSCLLQRGRTAFAQEARSSLLPAAAARVEDRHPSRHQTQGYDLTPVLWALALSRKPSVGSEQAIVTTKTSCCTTRY